MIDRSDEFECVGFWKRVLAQLLDFIIAAPVMIPISFFLSSWAFSHRSVTLSMLWVICWTGLWMLPVVFFGGTPGKLLIGVRIVDCMGNYLSWARALRRELFPIMLLQLLGLLVLWKTIYFMPEGVGIATTLERGELLYVYGQPFALLADILDFALFADIGMILFNAKKRAIHDFIAGSYVITKDSYYALSSAAENSDANGTVKASDSMKLVES